MKVKTMSEKTVHVIRTDKGWAVARVGGKQHRFFSTQREAIENAKVMVKRASSGQLVVHGLDGRIKQSATYGMPPIQDPPGRKLAKIEKAVDKITRDRLKADVCPPRD